MKKEFFYADIKQRALHIYQQYQWIIKEILGRDCFDCNLNFYIKEDARLGGKAWCKNKADHILINSGVLDNFYEYFFRISTSQTKNILKISNALDEDEMEGSYELLKFEHGQAIMLDSKEIDKKLAGLLTIFVSRFILTHELGHLLNGHCAYICTAYEHEDMQYIPMFDENRNTKSGTISPLDYRTMEMDADAFAATDSFRNLIHLYECFEDRVDVGLNLRPMELFHWWSFAIRSHFLISQRILKDEEYRADRTHLPSVARWSLIWGSISGLIENGIYKINYRDGDDEQKLVQSLVHGCLYAEARYNDQFKTHYHFVEEIAGNEEYLHYVNEVQENWKTLRQKLMPYARLPLYDPNA